MLYVLWICQKKDQTGSFELPGKCETPTANDSIRKAALTLNDSKILTKIGGDDLISKEAKYHHSCKNAYCLSGRRVEQKQGNEDHPGASTIDDIHSYVEQSIIISKRSELLTSVLKGMWTCAQYQEIHHSPPHSA